MENFKWYKASEMLPEDFEMPLDNFGIDKVFVVSINNGDLCCAFRWLDGSNWYWETDDDFYNTLVSRCGISHWMILEKPKTN